MLPTLLWLGFYPIWETLAPQLVVLGGAIAVIVYFWQLDRRVRLAALA